MTRGKHICKILKDIRRQIAEANDIELITDECRYKGNCAGTCPKCEAEVRYLEQELRAKSISGKAISLAGVSATILSMLMPTPTVAQATETNERYGVEKTSRNISEETFILSGKAYGRNTENIDSMALERLCGCSIINKTANSGVSADIDGNFRIAVQTGDTIQVSYIGYDTVLIPIDTKIENIDIILEMSEESMTECIAIGGMIPQERETSIPVPEIKINTPKLPKDKILTFDLNIVDENGMTIDKSNIEIEKILTDIDGEEISISIIPDWVEEDKSLRLSVRTSTIDKVYFRISGVGYVGYEDVYFTEEDANTHKAVVLKR